MKCNKLHWQAPLPAIGLWHAYNRETSLHVLSTTEPGLKKAGILFSLQQIQRSQSIQAISGSNIRKSRVSHELLANAASFVAVREFEKHCEANGRPQSHAEATALIAGFAGAFVDKVC
ncbi:hypothetical protein C8R47DRAFT_1117473 [Mycena vitilis]|nr:hypothetical protein C8R47DRAFT_1117473 [Mycena vitilis]